MTAVEILADWCAGLAWEDIPGTLQAKAQDHLLDTLGAAIAGRNSEPVRIAEQVFATLGQVRLLTAGMPRELRDAARINAISAHALEIDDTEGCDHSGAVVVPVVMALQDAQTGVGGSRMLTALVAGYEVGRRVQLSLGGYNAHNDSGWHSTATCGVFAAAAAAAVMLGLDAGQAASALAIAASSSAGGWAFARDGAITKQLHPGNAAANGIDAARLAAAGASGPLNIFEPVWGGLFQTHGNATASPGELTRGLGTTWHFSHSAIKPYASCRSTHSAIDAVLELLEDGCLRPDDITGLEVEVTSFLLPMICPDRPATVSAARMSLPVCLALLLQGRALTPADFDLFATPATTAWLQRTTVVVNDDDPAAEPLVRLRTTAGTFSNRHTTARGSAPLALSTAEVEAKFDELVREHVGIATAEAIKRFVRELPATPSPHFPEMATDRT
ncbi:2-methylcitrate dehydratase PrpD [Arthrobacter silviterrae]|uniref:MmgE/PrpD family protein n=1 Tax=Arthrobacter silviterrae TaxID=2026658 RepID=A0ABX0DJ62_9MICC|nr:MmgE/PrpD family protein [Arthrobacter silviterrae]MDQ0276452.1 2-methylcitrate dehydratase PrpD [Arthrobacter silviterrae]NGN84710.1 MmgE/PrpD family protein [Arthrobacter silviterrae]